MPFWPDGLSKFRQQCLADLSATYDRCHWVVGEKQKPEPSRVVTKPDHETHRKYGDNEKRRSFRAKFWQMMKMFGS